MEELLLKIKYSMTLDEIGEGFKLFQKKYQFKKSLVFTLVYLIALGLGIDFLIRDHTGIYGYILVGLSLGMIFYTWYKPVLIRKKLIATISSLAEETYTAEFYRDRIQITTVIEEPVIAENETETEEETDSPAKDEPHVSEIIKRRSLDFTVLCNTDEILILGKITRFHHCRNTFTFVKL